MKFLKYFSIMILLSVVKSDSEDICSIKSIENTSENAKSLNDIKIQEFPFIASYGHNLKTNQEWKWIHKCTASVLTKRTLLTAAHCLKKFDQKENSVIVGENDLNSDTGSISRQEMSISHVIRHPDYDNVTAYFDVAIIHTVEDIDLDDGVKPACLSNQTFKTTDFLENEVTRTNLEKSRLKFFINDHFSDLKDTLHLIVCRFLFIFHSKVKQMLSRGVTSFLKLGGQLPTLPTRQLKSKGFKNA